MRSILPISRSCPVLIVLPVLSLIFFSAVAAGEEPVEADSTAYPLLLIAWYSQTGHTGQMAAGVAAGARKVDSVRVMVKKVDQISRAELEAADGIIIGSPTYYANMAAPVKAFIDSWYASEVTLFDKVGGAFATGGGRTAGRELVIQSILMAMLNNGMVVAGPLYESWGTFGASAITAPPDEGVSESELDDARRLGERIARLLRRLKFSSKTG